MMCFTFDPVFHLFIWPQQNLVSMICFFKFLKPTNPAITDPMSFHVTASFDLSFDQDV